MPTYQYACTSCGERLEVVQKFSDDPLTVCPTCEGKLRKLFSPVGVVFKGSGFYKTDSRSSASRKSASDSGSSSTSEGSTPASTSGADKPAGGDKPSRGGSDKPAGGRGATGRPGVAATSRLPGATRSRDPLSTAARIDPAGPGPIALGSPSPR